MTEPTATAPALPVGAFLLPAVLYAYDLAQCTTTQDYPIVREILDDARPAAGGFYLLCHRPVREVGDGSGPGYNQGAELTRMAVALSDLLDRMTRGRHFRSTHAFDYDGAGITEDLVREAREAVYAARDAWGEQRAKQCAQGPVWVELSRYCVDGSIAIRLVCTCRCSHEPRRIFDGVTAFDAAAADPRFTANLDRWGVALTGSWIDHRYASNRFGPVRTRRAPIAPR